MNSVRTMSLTSRVHLPYPVATKCHWPGVIRKRQNQMVDYSVPEEFSTNDFIHKELCSNLCQWAKSIFHQGQGAFLAKADVKEAFHIIPVASKDRLLLAIQWKGELFLDKVLPIGLHLAPILFSAVADAIEWIIHKWAVQNIFHYVHNFFMVGKSNTLECTSDLAIIRSLSSVYLLKLQVWR